MRHCATSNEKLAENAKLAREANTERRKKEVENRRIAIVDLLVNANGSPMTAFEIGKVFGRGEETIRRDLVDYIIPSNNRIVAIPRKGYIYKPAEEKKPMDIFKKESGMEEKAPVVEEKQNNPMKNAEGYPDTTAGKAIMEVDGPEEGPAFAKAGDVYDCSCSDGSTLRYLILTSFEKFSIGLVLNPTKSKDVPKKYSRKIQAGLDTRFTDIRRVTTKPNKYMTQKVGHLGGEIFDSILKDTVRVFTMNDSEAVMDPDMWNALNAREKDLDKREAHLDERAKDILKQQMEADSIINRSQEMRDMLTQRQIELDELADKLNRREESMKKAEAEMLMCTTQTLQDKYNEADKLEVALLRQKVEIYEKLIFERGISL